MFTTFMLVDIWRDWKAHLREDAETEKVVIRHEEQIKEHATAINVLTGRVDVISGQLNHESSMRENIP